jgi:hypothetical protein
MQPSFGPTRASLPGPSRRITVEPIRVPTRAPAPAVPKRPPAIPERERERPPAREPVRSR